MSLLDPKWKYTHSTATDIRKTFAKARRALAQQQKAQVRPAKLHLMCAPTDAGGSATFGSRSKPSLFGTRSLPVEHLSEQKEEPAAMKCAGSGRLS